MSLRIEVSSWSDYGVTVNVYGLSSYTPKIWTVEYYIKDSNKEDYTNSYLKQFDVYNGGQGVDEEPVMHTIDVQLVNGRTYDIKAVFKVYTELETELTTSFTFSASDDSNYPYISSCSVKQEDGEGVNIRLNYFVNNAYQIHYRAVLKVDGEIVYDNDYTSIYDRFSNISYNDYDPVFYIYGWHYWEFTITNFVGEAEYSASKSGSIFMYDEDCIEGQNKEPLPWSWSTQNYSYGADNQMVAAAYNAITGSGEVRDFSHIVWNDLIRKVQDILLYKNKYIWYGFNYFKHIESAKMTTEDRIMTADRFNIARFVIGSFNTFNDGTNNSIAEHYEDTQQWDMIRGEPVLGQYFIDLATYANGIIKE